MSDVKKAGRPRKYSVEQPPQPVEQVVVIEEKLKSNADELTHTALSIAKNAQHKWCVYSFKFNPDTREVICSEVKEEFSKIGATQRFKKMAVDFLK